MENYSKMETYSSIKEFSKGEIIVEAGTIKDDIYIIKKGNVEVFKKDEDKEIIVSIIEEGGVFGELAFILERPYQYTVRAATNLEVQVFDPRTFSQLFDTDIGILLKPIIQSLAERVRHTESILHDSGGDLLEKNYEKNHIPVILQAETKQAITAMNGIKTIEILNFPFTVGRFSRRRSDDMFHHNNLYLRDTIPYSISRSHFEIVKKWKGYYFYDRGSKFGNLINNTIIGGDYGEGKKIKLLHGDNEIFLGTRKSKLKFTLKVL